MYEVDITSISDEYKKLTKEDLKNSLEKLQINNICLKDYDELETSNNISYKRVYTTFSSPFLIEKDTIFQENTLYINSKYYSENQNEIQEIICAVIDKIKSDKFSIKNKELISNIVIEAISKNKNLKIVSLTEYAKENIYTLTRQDYEILKKGSIEKIKTNSVSDDLVENFDPIISFNYDRPLISNYSYGELTNIEGTLYLDKITINDIENIKYINNPNLILQIEEKNIEDSLPVSKRLQELTKPNQVVIKVENKEKVYNKIKSSKNYQSENIFVSLPEQVNSYSIKDFLKYETTLYNILKPTKILSPFEKYIYIYNVVKQFKTYKEDNDNKRNARNLYDILDNEYMVCVGYSKLLRDLLKKVNINSIERNVSVDTSYDRKSENELAVAKKASHARAYIHIEDQKYNINGFYIADPTWDNVMNHDIYTHLALTNEEETFMKRYNFINSNIDFFELFNVTSLKDFYAKIFTNRTSLAKNNVNQNYISKIIMNLLISLKGLDNEFTNQLQVKYPEIISYYSSEKYEHEKEILDEIGNYIVSKVNKPISGKTIMLAVKEVYQKIYYADGKALKKLITEIAKENDTYQKFQFPKRYKIDEYGNKTELPNISDRFNLDENKHTR